MNLYEMYQTPKKKIIKIESYTHSEAFPLSIQHWSNGDITYAQSASSTRFDVEDLKSFHKFLANEGFTFHSEQSFA